MDTPVLSLTRSVAEGMHTWRVRAFDRAGNYSGWSAPTAFTVDTIPPDIPTLITPMGGAVIPTLTLTFAWTGSGDPSGFDFELDGILTTLNTPVLSLTRSVTEGAHTWRVRAFDRAGNYSDWSAPAAFIAFAPELIYLPLIARDFVPDNLPALACDGATHSNGLRAKNDGAGNSPACTQTE